jgi:exonuclease SbcC
MILRRLVLQNFRSYGDQETVVEFGKRLSLFEGEIGSGKSSLLYAIEFALFGLGELESKFLIRSSAASAKVELEFEVSGREYKVTRTIERKKGSRQLIQTKGWIEEPDGKKTEYPPTELRSRILQVLNFREKQGSKVSSRIYRFAIFTAQEEMKKVLSQSSEERIDTLRRAFGVEDYSFAISNSELVTKYLNDQSKMYKKLAEGIEEKQSRLKETKAELSRNRELLEDEKRKLEDLQVKIDASRSSLEELELESKKVSKLETLIPELERSMRVLQLQLREATEEQEKQARILLEVENAERRLSILKNEYENYVRNKEKLRELESLQQETLSIQKKIASLEGSISSKEQNVREHIESLQKESSTLKEHLTEFDRNRQLLAQLEQSLKTTKERLLQLPKVQSEISSKSSEIGALTGVIDTKVSELTEVKKRLAKLADLKDGSLCPLCGQKLDQEHRKEVTSNFEERINALRSEIDASKRDLAVIRKDSERLQVQHDNLLEDQRKFEEIEEQISESQKDLALNQEASQRVAQLEQQVKDLSSKLGRKEFALEEMRELTEAKSKESDLLRPQKQYGKLEESIHTFEDSGKLKSFQEAVIIASRKLELKETISESNSKVTSKQSEISRRAMELDGYRKELEESGPAIMKFAKTKKELEALQDLRSEAKEYIATLSERIASENIETQRLEDEIRKLAKSESKASLFRGISNWFDDYFLPAVTEIESYVFASINEDFNVQLQRFFSILVEEGDLAVTVDDNFTPIVEQGGYELGVQSLSGGERTAVALAYRLALNYLVKRVNETMQANLLILDEPTEGFSKEQIYRLRTVLEELDCDQVIIVSHERDLEAMADRVYRVEKINGKSIVSLAS